MIGPQEMLAEVQKLVIATTRATPQETANAFNERLAAAGFQPEAVAAIGQSLGIAWNMQHNMRPEEAISGGLTVGILLGFKAGRGDL